MTAPSASPPRLCVAVSVYNETVTGPMLAAALDAFAARGGDPAAVTIVEAPGAYELIAIAHAAAASGRYQGVLTLGCILRGETDHDRYLAQAVASGLAAATVATGVPIAFGVLTVNTEAQALARSRRDHDDRDNKGAEAMRALLDAVAAVAFLRGPAGPRPGERFSVHPHTRADKLATGTNA